MAFATIDVTKGITGTLPTGNGGTGSTSTTFVNAATNVTGALPVANGGTGLTSGTSGEFLKFTGSTTLATGKSSGQNHTFNASSSKYSTNSQSYVSIITPSTITPSSTSSHILVSFYCSMAVLSNTSNLGHLIIQREIGGSSYDYLYTSGHNTSTYTFKADGNKQGYGLSLQFRDSPNTTSAVRYYIQHKVDNTGMTMYLNQNQGGQGGYMFMVQQEVLA